MYLYRKLTTVPGTAPSALMNVGMNNATANTTTIQHSDTHAPARAVTSRDDVISAQLKFHAVSPTQRQSTYVCNACAVTCQLHDSKVKARS